MRVLFACFLLLVVVGGAAEAPPRSVHADMAIGMQTCQREWVTDREVLHNGSGWELNAVASDAAGKVWAVGRDNHRETLVLRLSGKGWSRVSTPDPSPSYSQRLMDVAAVSPTDVWAVGWYEGSEESQTKGMYRSVYRTLVQHWNGKGWSIVPSLEGQGELYGVAAVGRGEVWAVGWVRESGWNKPLIMRWNGSKWTTVPSPKLSSPANSGAVLYAVAAAGVNDIWTVGAKDIDGWETGGETLIMHWNGKRWVEATSFGPGRLRDIAVINSKEVWAVGYESNIRKGEGGYSKPLIVRWDGKKWSRVLSPNPKPLGWGYERNALYGIGAVTSHNIWAVGSVRNRDGTEPFVLRWNGKQWAEEVGPVRSYVNSTLNSVTATVGGKLVAVGRGEEGVYKPTRVIGTTPTVLPSGTKVYPTRVVDPDESALIAVMDRGCGK
jgi:hypothetical protein